MSVKKYKVCSFYLKSCALRVKYKSLIITNIHILPINLFFSINVLSSPFSSETKLLHDNVRTPTVRMRLSKTYAIFSHLEFHFPSILRSNVWTHPLRFKSYTAQQVTLLGKSGNAHFVKENLCHSVFQHFMDFLPIYASNNIYAFSSSIEAFT